MSEGTVDQLREARYQVDVVSVQNRYNLTDHEHEGVLEYCEQVAIAFIPWLPIANGRHATAPQLTRIAAELGATPAQVSLAWLPHRSPVIVPIPGTKSADQLAENVAASHPRLTTDQLTRLGSTR